MGWGGCRGFVQALYNALFRLSVVWRGSAGAPRIMVLGSPLLGWGIVGEKRISEFSGRFFDLGGGSGADVWLRRPA